MVARVEDATVGERLTNVARYLGTTGVTDSNARNDQGSASVTVKAAEPAVDLDVTKDAAAPTVTERERATFVITVTNVGSGNATGVEVEDVLPNGLSYYDDFPSQGSYDYSTGVWQVGDVGSGRVGDAGPSGLGGQRYGRADDQEHRRGQLGGSAGRRCIERRRERIGHGRGGGGPDVHDRG